MENQVQHALHRMPTNTSKIYLACCILFFAFSRFQKKKHGGWECFKLNQLHWTSAIKDRKSYQNRSNKKESTHIKAEQLPILEDRDRDEISTFQNKPTLAPKENYADAM